MALPHFELGYFGYRGLLPLQCACDRVRVEKADTPEVDSKFARDKRTPQERRKLLVIGLVSVVALVVVLILLGFPLGPPSDQSASVSPSSQPTSTTSSTSSTTKDSDQQAGPIPLDCGPTDQALGQALVSEIPSLNGVTPMQAAGNCPPSARAVSFTVNDGTSAGVIDVIFLPSSAVSAASSSGKVVRPYAPTGTKMVTATTQSGGELTLVSRPSKGSEIPAFGAALSDMAARIAVNY